MSPALEIIVIIAACAVFAYVGFDAWRRWARGEPVGEDAPIDPVEYQARTSRTLAKRYLNKHPEA